MIEGKLDLAAAMLRYIKTIIELQAGNNAGTSEDVVKDQLVEVESVSSSLDPLESMTGQVRSSKVVAAKVVTILSDLYRRSVTLRRETGAVFRAALDASALLLKQIQSLGAAIQANFDSAAEPKTSGDRLRFSLGAFKSLTYANLQRPSSPFPGLPAQIQAMSVLVADVAHLAKESSEAAQDFEKSASPWTVRAEVLRAASAANVATASELTRLKILMQDRLAQLQTRDQVLEEQNVKIELLESRTKDTRERTQKIESLQQDLEQGKKKELALVAALEGMSARVETLQNDKAGLQRLVESAVKSAGGGSSAEGGSVEGRANSATANEVKALRLEIRSLQGTVRFLRKDGLVVPDPEATTRTQFSWLHEPLLRNRALSSESRRRGRMELEQQGLDVIDRLVQLALTSKVVKLTELPSNKLAWRPAKDKSKWLCAQNEREWATWLGRKELLLQFGVDSGTVPRPVADPT